MANRDIVVIGASAGGVEALRVLAAGLPPSLPAAVFVVCHFPADARSWLPEILSRAGPLQANHIQDGEPIYPGRIYVAPPDYHVVLEHDRVRLNHEARENRFRPAIDPLFRSAARLFGPRVIGVLLSGGLSDGVAGLLAVRASGGAAVLQDPRDALLAALPQTANDIAGADHIVPVRDLAPLLVRLIHQTVPYRTATEADLLTSNAEAMVVRDLEAQAHNSRRGLVSVFSCPECGGCLWQADEDGALRFRCHVGHAYQGDALLAAQSDGLEAALWTAVRIFREKGVLGRQIALRQREAGHTASAERFDQDAARAEEYGDLIQQTFLTGLGDRGPNPLDRPKALGANDRTAPEREPS